MSKYSKNVFKEFRFLEMNAGRRSRRSQIVSQLISRSQVSFMALIAFAHLELLRRKGGKEEARNKRGRRQQQQEDLRKNK